jgi:hypothetical protein
MRPLPATTLAAIGCLWCPGAPAVAQLPQPQPPTQVDPGVADRGPGSVGLRRFAPDLRSPSGFDSVFEIERTNPFAPLGQRRSLFFIRAEGGLTAVFPRSVYSGATGSLIPQIPPDTVFYIGPLPRQFGVSPPLRGGAGDPPRSGGLPSTSPRPRAGNWLDQSYPAAEAARAARPFPERHEPIPPAPKRTIFEDEAYRQRRVAELLQEALHAPARRN